jgi:predicted alpha/beta-fold hydrolase
MLPSPSDRLALKSSLAAELGLPPFRARFPWWGADLQTLRDTLRAGAPWPDPGEPVLTEVGQGDQLLSFLDRPLDQQVDQRAHQPLETRSHRPLNQPQGAGADLGQARGLVLVLHGLGGSSQAPGVRRLGQLLQRHGFAVLRPNLRGAGPSRPFARGSYAAQCNRDLLPLLAQARQLAAGRPLLAVGLSLGGTVLLNGCLAEDSLGWPSPSPGGLPRLDGLACVSSPLDLVACSAQIDQPRNRLYQRWLLQRLHQQVRGEARADAPDGLDGGPGGPAPSIRSFDAQITAPRWGYPSVDAYYAEASPLARLLQGGPGLGPGLPPSLWLQASDDPWVPAGGTEALGAALAHAETTWAPIHDNSAVLITPGGGHNGFHGQGDPGRASWSDRLVLAWLARLVGGAD